MAEDNQVVSGEVLGKKIEAWQGWHHDKDGDEYIQGLAWGGKQIRTYDLSPIEIAKISIERQVSPIELVEQVQQEKKEDHERALERVGELTQKMLSALSKEEREEMKNLLQRGTGVRGKHIHLIID